MQQAVMDLESYGINFGTQPNQPNQSDQIQVSKSDKSLLSVDKQ
jgi:hypothetical protein